MHWQLKSLSQCNALGVKKLFDKKVTNVAFFSQPQK